MGRPPIGEVAMTGTERSRRRRASLAAKPAPKRIRELETRPTAELVAEIKFLDRIRELQERLRPALQAVAAKDQEIAQLKDRIAELEMELELSLFTLRNGRDGIHRKEYLNLLFCLHPDRVALLKDEKLTECFNAALQTLQAHEQLLVDENAEKRDRSRYERDHRTAAGEAEHFRKKAKRDAARKAKQAAAEGG
jgi:hypothetical protein